MSSPERVPIPGAGTERWRPSAFSVLATILLIIVLIGGILEIIPANEYMLLPGQALPVASMISVPGHALGHTKGQLYMTDVSLYKVNHLLEDLYGRLNSEAELQPAQTFTGNLSPTQYFQLNTQLMYDSIDKAEAAALAVARGYRLTFSNTGPEVAFIMPGTPAASALKARDVVEAVDDRAVHRARDVAPIVKTVRPGQTVTLKVLRGRRTLHLTVRTIASTNGQPDKKGKTPLIGVLLQDRIVFPIKIQIRAGDIGGPSAGLMFALGIVEHLENRDLSHGCKVAGTGTIDFDGAVGEIGGAKQKIIAAKQVGAKYFLVPDVATNVNPARANRGDVVVVPVKTLRQALGFLNHLKPCR